jgi:hypothetical protein
VTYDPHGDSVTYDIVFVPRACGAALEDAVAAVDDAGVPDAERDRWFARLVSVAREVLGDVEVDEAARVVHHAATGLQAEVAVGGVVIRVPSEGDVDPMLVMTLTHSLATELERATGLVGWDTALREPVSPQDVPPPRAHAGRKQSDDEEESGAARSAFVVPAVPDHAAQGGGGRRRRPWWRFWEHRQRS